MGTMKWWGWGDEHVSFTHEDKPALRAFIKQAIDIDVETSTSRPVAFDDLEISEPALSQDLRDALEAAVGEQHVSTDALDRVVAIVVP